MTSDSCPYQNGAQNDAKKAGYAPSRVSTCTVTAAASAGVVAVLSPAMRSRRWLPVTLIGALLSDPPADESATRPVTERKTQKTRFVLKVFVVSVPSVSWQTIVVRKPKQRRQKPARRSGRTGEAVSRGGGACDPVCAAVLLAVAGVRTITTCQVDLPSLDHLPLVVKTYDDSPRQARDKHSKKRTQR